MTAVKIRVLDGFDDAAFGREQWNELARRRGSVFLTWEWQRAWWESFGRGRLLLIAAERHGKPIALAPLFADSGMVFLVGSGGSDYLDILGDISSPEVLDAMILAARDRVQEFAGFRLYHVVEGSATGEALRHAGSRLGFDIYDEGDLAAPALDLSDRAMALNATRKKSLLRHENFFLRSGNLRVEHMRDASAILPHLDEFFEQHVSRWAATPYPSLFHDPAQRTFYRALTPLAAKAGWLRFTRLEWQGRSIAFHFGFYYGGRYLWYKPSFAMDLARHSPGEVLLRQLLLAAIEEGATTFDFGLGDEPFKRRFATTVNFVRTWALYPATSPAQRERTQVEAV